MNKDKITIFITLISDFIGVMIFSIPLNKRPILRQNISIFRHLKSHDG